MVHGYPRIQGKFQSKIDTTGRKRAQNAHKKNALQSSIKKLDFRQGIRWANCQQPWAGHWLAINSGQLTINCGRLVLSHGQLEVERQQLAVSCQQLAVNRC
jgi:hypothetical protein